MLSASGMGRVVVLGLAAVMVLGGCQAAPGGPSQAQTSVPGGTSPVLPGPTATASAPTAEPTVAAPEIPILDDTAFLAAASGACDDAKPPRVFSVDGPTKPAAKIPGYEWLHISVLEMRDPDGDVGPPPPLPPGEAYYPSAESLITIPGGTEALAVEAPFGAWVDLLACVALRAGETRKYTAERELRVTALDAVVWLVDRASGAAVGEPWLVEAGFPTLLNEENLVRVGGRLFNVANARPLISYAMGLARPLAGAYHGGEDSFVVAKYDKPADLPPGTRLLPGVNFVLRLVVLDRESGVIDFVELLCAPVGIVMGEPMRVATAVPHDLGRFSTSSADVAIEGEFSTQTEAKGRIRALSARASDCGVPASATWFVGLALQVRADGDGYQLLP